MNKQAEPPKPGAKPKPKPVALGMREIMARYNLSRPFIKRRIAAGDFPKGVVLGATRDGPGRITRRWDVQQLDAWWAARLERLKKSEPGEK